MDSGFSWNSVLVDRNVIRYRVAGHVDAPAMIHVHGFGISGTYLLPTAELLTDSFRVYVPDLPGFGRSPDPPRQLTIEELGESLAHFMAELGIERAVLVGNSLGCAIISQVIELAPERVDRAILVGLAGGLHNQPLGKALVQMARDGLREPVKLLPVAAPDYLRFGPIRSLRLFAAMTRFPAFERFTTMAVPVLVVIGSDDPLRPPWRRISEVMADLPDGLELVVFQGAAHAINFTHPRELAHTIGQYVAGEPIRMAADHPGGVPVLQLQRPA